MRAFHRLLWHKPDHGIARVTAYDIDDFDVTRLWRGEPMNAVVPSYVRLLVEQGEFTDVIRNPLSWPIWSNRFVDIVGRCSRADLQLFEAPLFYVETGQPIPGYWIVNVVRSIPCLDLSCSDIVYDHNTGRIAAVSRICIDGSRVTSDVHIFRIREWPFEVIFSAETAAECVGQSLTGLAFERCMVSG